MSAGTGWVLGTAPCTSVLRTRDGGKSWRGIPAPRAGLGRADGGSTGSQVSVLRFADQSNGWAGVGALYSTHNGGATWHQQHIGPSGSGVQAIETGGGGVYAVVDSCPPVDNRSCTSTYRVWASPIGSDHWTATTSALSGRGGGEGANLVVHGSDWFVPTTAGVYHGHGTSGATRLPNPCPGEAGAGAPAPALAAADSTHLDAMCGSEGAAGSARYQVYGSTDGGHHWTKSGGRHLLASGLYGLADNGGGVLIAAMASGRSDLERTTNDGVSFSPASVKAPTGGIAWADLGFTTQTQAFAILTGTAMYLSHNSGASFGRVAF